MWVPQHTLACKHHVIRSSLFGSIMYSGSGDIGWGWKVCTVNFSSLCKSAWQQLFLSQLGMIADFIICFPSLWSSSDVFDSFCSTAPSFPRCILYIKPSSLKGLLTQKHIWTSSLYQLWLQYAVAGVAEMHSPPHFLRFKTEMASGASERRHTAITSTAAPMLLEGTCLRWEC